jgi:hypothetical protein
LVAPFLFSVSLDGTLYNAIIIGGHFRDLAIHHFHPKAASFGFYSSRCKSTSGFLKCPAFIGSFIVETNAMFPH